MGKAIGGVLRFFLVLLVLAVIGYNTYEIAQLRAEVSRLRAARGNGLGFASGTLAKYAHQVSAAVSSAVLTKCKGKAKMRPKEAS